MKSSSVYAPFTALTLKVVGLILILSSLLDYILLAIPFNLLQRAWQLSFTTQIVDRGIIPMVGIAFLVAGFWIDNTSGVAPTDSKSSVQDLRFWAFLLSSLLGLIFLLLVPLHFNNIAQESDTTLKQIGQKATQAESQLDAQTQQVNALIKDPQKLTELEKAIESGQVQGEQLARLQALRQQLQAFKQDPKSLEKQVEAAQNQIRSRKLEVEQQAKTEAVKLGLKTGLSSLLLSIGYIVIGWTGLRNLGGTSASSRKA